MTDTAPSVTYVKKGRVPWEHVDPLDKMLVVHCVENRFFPDAFDVISVKINAVIYDKNGKITNVHYTVTQDFDGSCYNYDLIW
jgi:hypothetical protein